MFWIVLLVLFVFRLVMFPHRVWCLGFRALDPNPKAETLNQVWDFKGSGFFVPGPSEPLFCPRPDKP